MDGVEGKITEPIVLRTEVEFVRLGDREVGSQVKRDSVCRARGSAALSKGNERVDCCLS